jgi:hypothetical protein
MAPAGPVADAAGPDPVVPSAGTLSRISAALDQPQAPRANEPPLIIKRKAQGRGVAVPQPGSGRRIVMSHPRNRAGARCEQTIGSPVAPGRARGQAGVLCGKCGGRPVIGSTARITPRLRSCRRAEAQAVGPKSTPG